MAELIPFPRRCEGCDGDQQSRSCPTPDGMPALCKSCASLLRRNLYGLLPERHQEFLGSAILDACYAYAARQVRYEPSGSEAAFGERVRSLGGEIFSQIALRCIRPDSEGIHGLADLFITNNENPANDPRVVWLLGEIASRRYIAQRAVDAYREDVDWIAPKKPSRSGEAAPASRSSQQAVFTAGPRYLPAEVKDLEGETFDPTFRPPEPTAEERLQIAEAVENAPETIFAAVQGLYLLLVDALPADDDAVTLYRLLAFELGLANLIGQGPGRSKGANMPATKIVAALNESAGERPWDNRPWTARRFDNARDKLLRFCQRLPGDTQERRLFLAALWVEFNRRNQNP